MDVGSVIVKELWDKLLKILNKHVEQVKLFYVVCNEPL